MGKRRRGGSPQRGTPHQQERWVPPTKAEKMQMKKAPAQETDQELTIEQRLNIAKMSSSLPNVDMHGYTRDQVGHEVDTLIQDNPDQSIRVIYGKGTGTLRSETMRYLHTLKRQKKILGYAEDTNGASVVIITPEE